MLLLERLCGMYRFNLKFEGFFPKVNVQHAVAGSDFLLLETLAPAVGKLAFQVILQVFHFCFSERRFQPNRSASREFSVSYFHRRDGAEYLRFDFVVSALVKIEHQVPAVRAVALVDGIPNAIFVVDHINA